MGLSTDVGTEGLLAEALLPVGLGPRERPLAGELTEAAEHDTTPDLDRSEVLTVGAGDFNLSFDAVFGPGDRPLRVTSIRLPTDCPCGDLDLRVTDLSGNHLSSVK